MSAPKPTSDHDNATPEPARRFTIATVQHEGRSVFHFEELPSDASLPSGAEFDNWGEDTETGEVFHLYALPGTELIGRTVAWQMFLESLSEDEEEDESEDTDA